MSEAGDRNERREAALRSALDRLIEGDPAAAVDDTASEAERDPVLLALDAYSRYGALDYTAAVQAADHAVAAAPREVSDDPDAVLLAWVTRGLVSAGRRTVVAGELDSWTSTAPGLTPTGDPLVDAFDRFDSLAPNSDLAQFIRYLAGEAAVACGRFELAERIIAGSGPLPTFLPDSAGQPHPSIELVVVMRARALAFRGRASEAAELLHSRRSIRRPNILSVLLSATETLVRGTAGERAEVRALADRLELARPRPVDYVSVGCYLLVAWGLEAVGDVRRSARLALFAGPDSLDMLSIVSTGLTLELLVAAALDEGDLDAAEAWRERAEPLHAEPIANSSAARLVARIELHARRFESALTWAERAVELAELEGRVVEVAQARRLVERAREGGDPLGSLGGSLAQGGMPVMARASQSTKSELRGSGRRLRPVAGSEWQGLSLRERDIALMVAEGLTNREIGHELFLSEHTVRAHVSRVLAAFGAASRFAVAARVAELFPASGFDAPDPAALTPRQRAVAERIAFGLGNAEIGRDLELSVKTVEKHIGEIFRRWNVGSRVGIARIVRAHALGSPELFRPHSL